MSILNSILPAGTTLESFEVQERSSQGIRVMPTVYRNEEQMPRGTALEDGDKIRFHVYVDDENAPADEKGFKPTAAVFVSKSAMAPEATEDPKIFLDRATKAALAIRTSLLSRQSTLEPGSWTLSGSNA